MKRIARIYEQDQEVFVLAFEDEASWRSNRWKGRAVEPYVELERVDERSEPLWRKALKLREEWFEDVYLRSEYYEACPFVDWEKSAALFAYWAATSDFANCEFLEEAVSPIEEEL